MFEHEKFPSIRFEMQIDATRFSSRESRVGGEIRDYRRGNNQCESDATLRLPRPSGSGVPVGLSSPGTLLPFQVGYTLSQAAWCSRDSGASNKAPPALSTLVETRDPTWDPVSMELPDDLIWKCACPEGENGDLKTHYRFFLLENIPLTTSVRDLGMLGPCGKELWETCLQFPVVNWRVSYMGSYRFCSYQYGNELWFPSVFYIIRKELKCNI